MNVRQWACKRRLQGCYHVRIVENVVYIAAVTVLGIFSSQFGGATLVPRAPGCYGSRAPVPRRSKELLKIAAIVHLVECLVLFLFPGTPRRVALNVVWLA